MKVTVLSLRRFENLVRGKSREQLNKEDKKIFYLSIHDPQFREKTHFYPDDKDFKTMHFYDLINDRIDEDGDVFHRISDEQLQELYDYLMEHKDYDEFIVHCFQGISRSGAVGEFMNELFGEEWREFKLRNMNVNSNPYILEKLQQIHSK